jgi:hypothetical protein
MPLRDHFHNPIKRRLSWSELHGGWPMEIVRALSRVLPPGYRSGPTVHLGTSYEVDIAMFDEYERRADFEDNSGGSIATATKTAKRTLLDREVVLPTLTLEADLSTEDTFEVKIFDTEAARELVAVIELVSPSNADRPKNRDSFLSKVSAFLQQGVGVTLVDVVTEKSTNFCSELCTRLNLAIPGAITGTIYAATLSPRMVGVPRSVKSVVDLWYYPLQVGQALPTIPIWLSHSIGVELPLEECYEETCRVLGVD